MFESEQTNQEDIYDLSEFPYPSIARSLSPIFKAASSNNYWNHNLTVGNQLQSITHPI